MVKWSEISIHTVNEAIEPIANILYEAGAGGVVIEDSLDLIKEYKDEYGEIYELDPIDYPDDGVIIKAYLPVNSFLNETIALIEQKVTNLSSFNIDIGENKVTVSEVAEEDWATAWKKYYNPTKVSQKFIIVPSWEKYEPVSTEELIIELDPGMAFGTGTHPTTITCIQALEKTVKKGDAVIDVGTGSGVLSIAAALLGAEKVQALDLDEVAVSAAKQNVVLNKVDDIVTVTRNNLLQGIATQVDIIVANILAEIIVNVVDDAAKTVKKGGFFIASGIIREKKAEINSVIEQAGFTIVEVIEMEEWVTIISTLR